MKKETKQKLNIQEKENQIINKLVKKIVLKENFKKLNNIREYPKIINLENENEYETKILELIHIIYKKITTQTLIKEKKEETDKNEKKIEETGKKELLKIIKKIKKDLKLLNRTIVESFNEDYLLIENEIKYINLKTNLKIYQYLTELNYIITELNLKTKNLAKLTNKKDITQLTNLLQLGINRYLINNQFLIKKINKEELTFEKLTLKNYLELYPLLKETELFELKQLNNYENEITNNIKKEEDEKHSLIMRTQKDIINYKKEITKTIIYYQYLKNITTQNKQIKIKNKTDNNKKLQKIIRKIITERIKYFEQIKQKAIKKKINEEKIHLITESKQKIEELKRIYQKIFPHKNFCEKYELIKLNKTNILIIKEKEKINNLIQELETINLIKELNQIKL